ncbi:MAG: hypothetical protein NVS3B5_20690 [Sphingomicrobium sp.]
MTRIDRRIDVTQAANLGQTLELAASIFLPDPASLPARPVVIFAVPGGGYSRQYFFMRPAGHEGYDESIYHTARGTIYVAIDHVCNDERLFRRTLSGHRQRIQDWHGPVDGWRRVDSGPGPLRHIRCNRAMRGERDPDRAAPTVATGV